MTKSIDERDTVYWAVSCWPLLILLLLPLQETWSSWEPVTKMFLSTTFVTLIGFAIRLGMDAWKLALHFSSFRSKAIRAIFRTVMEDWAVPSSTFCLCWLVYVAWPKVNLAVVLLVIVGAIGAVSLGFLLALGIFLARFEKSS